MCKIPLTDKYRYSSNDESVDEFRFIVCKICHINLQHTGKMCEIEKHYASVTLLARQLLINYLPQGYIIPQISELIIKNIIDININDSGLRKYRM